ncbi:MAG: hypothetical protein R3B09_25380 [Nannocystaceae bacterium]
MPLRLVGAWAQGRLALQIGAWLKRRLLVGALTLEPDVIRRRGGGQLLAQVYESEAVEALALRGLLSAGALIDLAMAAWVLAQGAAPGLHVALLAGWTGVVLLACLGHARARVLWARERLQMTQDLVERMVGHTTRLVQEAPERWHRGEERALGGYRVRSAAMDRRSLLLSTVASRGWLVLGILGLGPAMLGEAGALGTAPLAIAFGGVLLALGAFVGLADGLRDLTDLWISWREVAPLAAAADRYEDDRPRRWSAAAADARPATAEGRPATAEDRPRTAGGGGVGEAGSQGSADSGKGAADAREAIGKAADSGDIRRPSGSADSDGVIPNARRRPTPAGWPPHARRGRPTPARPTRPPTASPSAPSTSRR